ncbi:MAG: TadE/TadG family type IV pilus assembly protein [bacterium]
MNRDTQAGAVAVEVALIGPGLLLLMALLIFGGRNALATGAVDQAAVDAARAASLARSAAQADAAAHDAAQRSLVDQDLACATTDVELDISGLGTQPGEPAQVTATVRCTLGLSDLGLPGLPASKTITATSVSVIDTYRERQ